MISRPVWSRWWGVLCERYGRQNPSDELAAIYLAGCAAALDDATFPAAVARVVATREFFPTVEQIVGAVQVEAAPELRAALAFAGVKALGKYTPGCGYVWDRDEIRRQHGEAAAVAFYAIGGGDRVHGATGQDLIHARRAFVEAFVEAEQYGQTLEAIGRALPASVQDHRRPINRLAPPQRIGTLLPAITPTHDEPLDAT